MLVNRQPQSDSYPQPVRFLCAVNRRGATHGLTQHTRISTASLTHQSQAHRDSRTRRRRSGADRGSEDTPPEREFTHPTTTQRGRRYTGRVLSGVATRNLGGSGRRVFIAPKRGAGQTSRGRPPWGKPDAGEFDSALVGPPGRQSVSEGDES